MQVYLYLSLWLTHASKLSHLIKTPLSETFELGLGGRGLGLRFTRTDLELGLDTKEPEKGIRNGRRPLGPDCLGLCS